MLCTSVLTPQILQLTTLASTNFSNKTYNDALSLLKRQQRLLQHTQNQNAQLSNAHNLTLANFFVATEYDAPEDCLKDLKHELDNLASQFDLISSNSKCFVVYNSAVAAYKQQNVEEAYGLSKQCFKFLQSQTTLNMKLAESVIILLLECNFQLNEFEQYSSLVSFASTLSLCTENFQNHFEIYQLRYSLLSNQLDGFEQRLSKLKENVNVQILKAQYLSKTQPLQAFRNLCTINDMMSKFLFEHAKYAILMNLNQYGSASICLYRAFELLKKIEIQSVGLQKQLIRNIVLELALQQIVVPMDAVKLFLLDYEKSVLYWMRFAEVLILSVSAKQVNASMQQNSIEMCLFLRKCIEKLTSLQSHIGNNQVKLYIRSLQNNVQKLLPK